MLEDEVGDLVDATLHGQKTAAAANEGLHARKVHALLGENVGDGLGAKRQLFGQRGEARQLLRAVADGLGEDALLAVKQGDLGGGGAGVDDKDAPGAGLALLVHGYSPSASAWARTQLMTTLPTISDTGALRLQSQTIFLKPWSMGP